MPTKVACICCNGELHNKAEAKMLAENCDLLIAADGGADHLAQLALKPKLIIGDMDSLAQDPWQDDESLGRLCFPQDKDRSDTELAVEWAIEHEFNLVMLLASTGRRIDHTLGQCALLLRFPGVVVICDDGFCVRGVSANQQVGFQGQKGALVSLIPFASNTRVTTSGLHYSLLNETLAHATHGLSNEISEGYCSISVSAGRLLLSVEGYALLPKSIKSSLIA